MEKKAKAFITGLIGLISIFVGLVLVYFAPFLIMASSFDIKNGAGESVIQNNNFGIEFRVKSECELKNRYHRYFGVTLWDGLLICGNGDPGTVFHLVVSNNVDSMIGGVLYRDLPNVYYDELRPEAGIFRVRSNDGKQALLITLYEESPYSDNLWNDVLVSIRAYKE